MARAEIPLTIIDPATGNAIVGASVAVKLRATGVSAVVYAAETGATTVANPRTSDANGRVSGWVDRGAYQFDISGTGLTSYTEFWDAATSSDGGLDTAWLAASSVTTVKLDTGAVTTAKLAADAVTFDKAALVPFCAIYRNAAWTTTTGFDTAPFDAVTSDNGVATTGTAMANVATNRIIVRRTGLYQVSGQLSLAANSQADWRQASITLDGATVASNTGGYNGVLWDSTVNVNAVLGITAGSYLQMVTYTNNAAQVVQVGATRTYLRTAFLGRVV